MAEKWEGEHSLARAVIEQAWRDARKPGQGAHDAKEFLLTPSPILKHWIHQAGMSRACVMEQARKEFGA